MVTSQHSRQALDDARSQLEAALASLRLAARGLPVGEVADLQDQLSDLIGDAANLASDLRAAITRVDDRRSAA